MLTIVRIEQFDRDFKLRFNKGRGLGYVARLTGLCHRWGYEREFLKPSIDYSKSSSKGTRGVYAEYVFDAGPYDLFQIEKQVSWGSVEKYFCCFEMGEEIQLPEQTVKDILEGILKYAE